MRWVSLLYGRMTAAVLAAAVTILAATAPARAQQPVEAAVRAWIAAIDFSPDWRAAAESVALDSTGRATVSRLVIRSELPGFVLDIPVVTIAGFASSAAGTFAAGEIVIPSGSVAIGTSSIALADVRLTDVTLPTGPGFTFDGARPFSGLVKALAPLTSVRLATARIGALVLSQVFRGATSRVVYQKIEIDGWNGSRIANARAQSLKSEAPSPDPLVTMTVAEAESRDIDLDAFFAVYDPDRYVGGAGDGVWRKAAGSTTQRDVVIAIGKLSGSVGEVTIDNFRLRQPRAGPGMIAGMDYPSPAAPAPADPLAALALLDTFSIYGADSFRINGVAFGLSDTQRLRLGALALTDASTDRIGTFALEDFEGEAGDGNAVRIGRLGFGGLTLPSKEVLTAAATAFLQGGDVDTTALLPPLDYVEALAIDVEIQGMPKTTLERFRLDLADRVGVVPTTVKLDLAGADIDASLVPEPRLRRLLANFGYKRLTADAALDLAWAQDGTIGVKDFRVAMKGVGALSGNADLSGLKPADTANVKTIEDAIAAMVLNRATVTFTDDTLVTRALTEQAKRVNADPAVFREQFAKGLPLLLTFLGNPDLQKQLAGAVQTFIRTPGSITLDAAPPSPLPLAAVIETAKATPFALLGLLAVKVSAVAGAAPPTTPPPLPPPAPAPAGGDMRKTLPAE